MSTDAKTFTVDLSEWEVLELIRAHTRAIKKVTNAAGKAVTNERVNLLPRIRTIDAILDAAKAKIDTHSERGKQLVKLLKP